MINQPTKVILHCAATPDEADHFDIDDIRRWHIARGFSDVGYHAVIKKSGEVQLGRSEHEVGAHCQGQNEGSLGVCYIGTKRPTAMQLLSIMNLYKSWYSKYNIGSENWFGHYEFNPGKECPGFSMEVFRMLLRAQGLEVII